MKLIITVVTFLILNFPLNEQVRDTYTVIKVYETDTEPLYLIRNEKNTGLIVGTNDSLDIDDSFKKIEAGKIYLFVMTERKFRGKESTAYGILDENGELQKIWDVKKDGKMPSMYIAKNVKGRYIQPITK